MSMSCLRCIHVRLVHPVPLLQRVATPYFENQPPMLIPTFHQASRSHEDDSRYAPTERYMTCPCTKAGSTGQDTGCPFESPCIADRPQSGPPIDRRDSDIEIVPAQGPPHRRGTERLAASISRGGFMWMGPRGREGIHVDRVAGCTGQGTGARPSGAQGRIVAPAAVDPVALRGSPR